jgi:NAD(P)-dependent dehydrogenase (short-subunit alcohol dehydrogenase family)
LADRDGEIGEGYALPVAPEGFFVARREAQMAKQTVLITGSNSGIGRATAELLAGRGYRVIATMRDPGKGRDLAEAASTSGWDLSLVPLDVRSDESVREAFRQAGEVDVLVNNAGFEVWGPIEEMTTDDLADQFETNVYGPFRCISAVLPAMRERGSGVIVNVSSVAGRVAGPLNGLYAASKFALEAMSESLHYEAGHFGVRVHIVEPGGVDTAFTGNRRHVGAAAGDEASPYRPMVTQWEEAMGRLAADTGRSQAGAVAEVILEAIENGGKLRYPAGPDAQMVLTVRRQVDDEAFEAGMRQRLGLTW